MPVRMGEESSLVTPPSGYGDISVKTDDKLYFINDGGTETQLTGLGTITGSRADTEAALANLLTALASAGLIVDSTTT
jgi:hypothetical protein